MGLLGLFKGKGSDKSKCGFCKKKGESLPFTKKFPDGVKYFCSKECSRKYRIDRKKRAKAPPTMGSLPW